MCPGNASKRQIMHSNTWAATMMQCSLISASTCGPRACGHPLLVQGRQNQLVLVGNHRSCHTFRSKSQFWLTQWLAHRCFILPCGGTFQVVRSTTWRPDLSCVQRGIPAHESVTVVRSRKPLQQQRIRGMLIPSCPQSGQHKRKGPADLMLC